MYRTVYSSSIDKIAKNIDNRSEHRCGPGLLSGKSGIALFYFYYSRLRNNQKYYEKGIKNVLDVFNDIKSGYNFPTYCDGLAGYAWTVEHLVQKKFISRDDVPFLDDMDIILHKQMMKMVKNGNYDFLHGAIGIGVYFITRSYKKECLNYLIEFIDELEKQGEYDNEKRIKWSVITNEKGLVGVNLGLAHGMPSIISFLAKVVNLKIHLEKTRKLLNSAVDYMLSKQIDVNKNGMHFPNVVFTKDVITSGRKMGWCYGDMGRAISLYQAGIALDNEVLKKNAVNIVLETTKNRDLVNLEINDPAICHGTSGIAYMYYRMFLDSQIEIFREASLFWLQETIRMPKFKKALSNFKKWFPNEVDSKSEFGILEGVTGIGLVFMALELDENINSWDQCLLLS